MMRTIKDLKSKTSSMESDGVYIMPFNPKYEKNELEGRMLKVVEEQPSVAISFRSLTRTIFQTWESQCLSPLQLVLARQVQ